MWESSAERRNSRPRILPSAEPGSPCLRTAPRTNRSRSFRIRRHSRRRPSASGDRPVRRHHIRHIPVRNRRRRTAGRRRGRHSSRCIGPSSRGRAGTSGCGRKSSNPEGRQGRLPGCNQCGSRSKDRCDWDGSHIPSTSRRAPRGRPGVKSVSSPGFLSREGFVTRRTGESFASHACYRQAIWADFTGCACKPEKSGEFGPGPSMSPQVALSSALAVRARRGSQCGQFEFFGILTAGVPAGEDSGSACVTRTVRLGRLYHGH